MSLAAQGWLWARPGPTPGPSLGLERGPGHDEGRENRLGHSANCCNCRTLRRSGGSMQHSAVLLRWIGWQDRLMA